MHTSFLPRSLRAGALLASLAVLTPSLHAQAQFAGTYIGLINIKVTVPVLGTTESTSSGYIATVRADGTVDVAGLLTGTVNAAGQVTFTSGTGIATLGIRSATIASNQFSSNYGDVLGNGTTQFRFNGSTNFTAASGGGSTGGGSTGGGTGGGTTGGSSSGSSFQNGSFETGPNPGSSWISLASGATSITGWRVTAGDIDYIGTAWTNSDGVRGLDLSGVTAGAIAQTFTTTAGRNYTITFDLAGNPGFGAGTGVKNLTASVTGANGTTSLFSRGYTFDTTGKTLANMGWVNNSFTFVADGTSATLTFRSGTDGAYGPAIDNVRLDGSTGSAASGTTGGLVTQLKFDGNTTDSAGSANGTISGGVTYGTGVLGQAAQFNGTNGYVAFGTAALVSDQAPFSVSFWFKPTSAQLMVPLRLRTASTEFATRIGLNASDSSSLGASIYFGFRGSAGIISRDPRYYIASTLNQWTHLTFVFKGGNKSAAASWELIVNGESLALATTGTVGGSANANEIGRDGGGGSYVAGLIDDVRISTAATTVSAATALYAAVPTVTGVDLAPTNFTAYRNKVGQTFSFAVTGSTSGSVWGTDIYTDDSNVAKAAVHAGVVAVGETKTVAITILPGQSGYPATTRNGVASASWGAWSGSYSFAGATGSAGVPTAAPVAAYAPPATQSVAVGGRLSLSVTVGGVGPFTYAWFLNGTQIAGAVSASYTIASVSAAHAGTYTVRASNSAGTTTVNAGIVTVASAGSPSVTLQPLSKTVAPGARFSLLVSASGSGNLAYQWRKDNVALPGATQNVFEIQGATAVHSGNYTCTITNAAGTVTTAPATIAVTTTASRPANISCRTKLAPGGTVTPGFFVDGTGTKRVLIRAVGPGLGQFGLEGLVADPKFDLYRQSNNSIVASNDNYDATAAATFAPAGAFALPAGSRDAALVVSLQAGQGYSVQVSGAAGNSGIVLLEVYDLDAPATATNRLVNVSVRGQVGTGDDVLILGVVVGGTGKRTLLVRGIGPKLAAFGVQGTLSDPHLEIFDSNNRSVLDNDNWGAAPFVTEQALAANYVGAFALDTGSRDAATLALLDPGAYNIVVKGADGGTGESLVEVYDVP
ncbi:MAG: choice-of-anchor C family protein [Verrucomicrobia bacterium]|nr:choice-of-anchor C family protein [Verrucomicrobiota bacterium]